MLQLSPRPLTASAADSRLFVDREDEVRRIERAVKLRLNTYVAGGPGSGKTSLLHRAEAALGRRATFLNAEGATTPEDVAHLVVAAAPETEGATGRPETWPPVRALRRLPSGPPHAVVLLDGVDDGLRAALFGRHRDELWELRVLWVVTGRSRRLDPPEDAFFTSVIELDDLDEDATIELLRRRAGTGADPDAARVRTLAADLAAVLGPTSPRAALGAAGAVLLAEDPDEALEGLRRHATMAAALPETAQLVLDAILTLGAVHSGDGRLLDEVGVTRTRVVQLLRDLKAKGLVRTVPRGRRVLYDLAWRAS
ncbi:MAG TPA: hypothetical protein VGB14_09465 [Acidimicrobiales bacterium]